jgi:hypothetical protein
MLVFGAPAPTIALCDDALTSPLHLLFDLGVREATIREGLSNLEELGLKLALTNMLKYLRVGFGPSWLLGEVAPAAASTHRTGGVGIHTIAEKLRLDMRQVFLHVTRSARATGRGKTDSVIHQSLYYNHRAYVFASQSIKNRRSKHECTFCGGLCQQNV